MKVADVTDLYDLYAVAYREAVKTHNQRVRQMCLKSLVFLDKKGLLKFDKDVEEKCAETKVNVI